MGILDLLLGYDLNFYWILCICKEVSPTTTVWLFWSLYWIPFIFKEVSLLCLVGVKIPSSIWVWGIVWLTSLFNWCFLGSWLSLKDFILCMYAHTVFNQKLMEALTYISWDFSLCRCLPPLWYSALSIQASLPFLLNSARLQALFAFPLPAVCFLISPQAEIWVYHRTYLIPHPLFPWFTVMLLPRGQWLKTRAETRVRRGTRAQNLRRVSLLGPCKYRINLKKECFLNFCTPCTFHASL